MIEIATLIPIFVMVSFWEYCMFFYEQRALPYTGGYNIFSLIQWVIVAVALIKIGWLYGIIAFALCMFVLQYVTHFTLGIIYNLLFKTNPVDALCGFSIMVYITGGLTVVLLFVR